MTTLPPVEARSGLAPWDRAELPAPPDTRGLRLLGVVGPGLIVLGASIGSGEFLLVEERLQRGGQRRDPQDAEAVAHERRDVLEGTVRSITDLLWTGSARSCS